jgi:hypothetical protein
MTNDTWPEIRPADPLMTVTIRVGRIGTVVGPAKGPGLGGNTTLLRTYPTYICIGLKLHQPVTTVHRRYQAAS